MSRSRVMARAALLAVGLPLLALGGAQLALGDANMPLVWAGAFAAWVYLPAWPALVAAAALRDPVAAAPSAVVAVGWLVGVASAAWPLAAPTAAEADLRVLSANLLMVHPDPGPLAREIAAADADVLVLLEYSPRWAVTLDEAGVRDAYPHGVEVVQEDSFGIALWSRRPLVHAELVGLHGVAMARAVVDVDGRPLEVLGVHTLPPRTVEYTAVLQQQVDQLVDLAGRDGARLLVGDLNLSEHNRGLKRLHRAGLRSAHVDRGRGGAATFPNGLFPLPPVRLDHALVSDALDVVDVREGAALGSDHAPVVVDVAWR